MTRTDSDDLPTDDAPLSGELRRLEIEARRLGHRFLAHLIGVAAAEAEELEGDPENDIDRAADP